MNKSFAVWKLRSDKGVGAAELKAWADRVHQRDPQVLGEIAKYFAVLLDERRQRNKIRSDALERSFRSCALSVKVTTIELLLVLGVRLLTSL